jgi:hypothetical protein
MKGNKLPMSYQRITNELPTTGKNGAMQYCSRRYNNIFFKNDHGSGSRTAQPAIARHGAAVARGWRSHDLPMKDGCGGTDGGARGTRCFRAAGYRPSQTMFD